MDYLIVVTYLLNGSSKEYTEVFNFNATDENVLRKIESIIIWKYNYTILDIKTFKQDENLHLDYEKVQSMIKEIKQKHKRKKSDE